MADPADVAATKAFRRELNKSMIDVNQADIRVMHGVAYVRGVVRSHKGGPPDVKAAIQNIGHNLVTRRTIKECVVDCIVRS